MNLFLDQMFYVDSEWSLMKLCVFAHYPLHTCTANLQKEAIRILIIFFLNHFSSSNMIL